MHARLRAFERPAWPHARFGGKIDTTGHQGTDFWLADTTEIIGESAVGYIESEALLGILHDLPLDGKLESAVVVGSWMRIELEAALLSHTDIALANGPADDLVRAVAGVASGFDGVDCRWDLLRQDSDYYADGRNCDRIRKGVLELCRAGQGNE